MIITDAERKEQYAKDLARLMEENRLHELKVQKLKDELAKLIEEGKPTKKTIDHLMAVIDGIFSAEDKEEVLKKAGVATTATTNKPAKVTKTQVVRGRRTRGTPSVPVPDNLGKGTRILMFAGKYNGQAGNISSIATKDGDRTFFLLLSGGKRTSVKAGTYGNSWKVHV